MKSTEAIRSLMKENQVGPTKLAQMIDVKSPRIITDRLAQPNLSIKIFKQMHEVFHYRIVIIPSDAELPENGIEIDS